MGLQGMPATTTPHMHTQLYTHKLIHILTCAHTHTHTLIYTQAHTHTPTCTHIHTPIHRFRYTCFRTLSGMARTDFLGSTSDYVKCMALSVTRDTKAMLFLTPRICLLCTSRDKLRTEDPTGLPCLYTVPMQMTMEPGSQSQSRSGFFYLMC